MTKLSEKEIQDILESGSAQSLDKDTKLYKEVFDALSTEPEYKLSPQFAANIISTVEAKADKTERVIYVIGVLGLVVSFFLTIALIVVFGGESMLRYIPHLLIGSGVIILAQYFDRLIPKNIA
ncbi:hypothetical protein [Fulvivirga lutimaris]|uniref:hypothetical protein n=1 Tax=Fulvivirga lutimaris TaxID=1819566 RepID=UPI0012BB5A24|nr:hypothetical protein [Fulvivirga lutimaris]MTI39181.1 hypothetical protein [Fulvivirga lutimaris]